MTSNDGMIKDYSMHVMQIQGTLILPASTDRMEPLLHPAFLPMACASTAPS